MPQVLEDRNLVPVQGDELELEAGLQTFDLRDIVLEMTRSGLRVAGTRPKAR